MADLETLAATKRTHAEGAAPATPSAGQVVIYAKTDGIMYQKDDTGAETSLAASGGSGLTTGTTFPGSPSTGDRYRRSDIGYQVFYYDGTRWLSEQEYRIDIATQRSLNPSAGSVGAMAEAALVAGGYDIWLVRYEAWTYVATTNNGSNYWTVPLAGYPGGSTLASFTTASDTASTHTGHTAAIGSALGTTIVNVALDLTKTASPGSIYAAVALIYKRIAT